METYTDYKEIRKALKRLKPFTEPKPFVPILSYVKLEAQDGKLRITVPKAENEISFTTATVLTTYDEYTVLVKYTDLRKVVDKCKSNIQFIVKDNNLTFKLKGKDPSDFVKTPGIRDDMQVSSAVSYGDIKSELGFVSSATETSTQANYTSGVLFDYSETDRLRLIGTDGRRLHSTYTTSRCHSVGDDKPKWLVPVNWVKAFNGLKVPDDESVYLEFYGDDQLRWRIPSQGLSGTVSLLDTPYPDFEKVIPDDCTSKFQLDTQATIDSLNAVAVVATQDDGRDMVVVNANGTLNLSARSDTMGEASGMVPCNHLAGPETSFALNVHYFTETLKIAGKHNVLMANSGSLEPVRFDYDETDRIAVVMPVRLPE